MNKHNAKDYLPLVQALADGKTIQLKVESLENPEGVWKDWENPKFDREVSAYRIKPEPREWKASVVTAEAQKKGCSTFYIIGDLVAYDEGDENDGYEVIRVREILD